MQVIHQKCDEIFFNPDTNTEHAGLLSKGTSKFADSDDGYVKIASREDISCDFK